MKYFVSLLVIFIFSLTAFGANYENCTKVQTIVSDFIMEKHLQIATKPLISKGVFYFQRPDFLRWEYKTPFVSGILLNKNKVYSWKNINNKKNVQDISKQPMAKMMLEQIKMFISMDIDSLKKQYNFVEGEKTLELLPKKENHTIKKVVLTFNDSFDSVIEVNIEEVSGDSTKIKFNNTLLDTTLPQEIKNIISYEKK